MKGLAILVLVPTNEWVGQGRASRRDAVWHIPAGAMGLPSLNDECPVRDNTPLAHRFNGRDENAGKPGRPYNCAIWRYRRNALYV